VATANVTPSRLWTQPTATARYRLWAQSLVVAVHQRLRIQWWLLPTIAPPLYPTAGGRPGHPPFGAFFSPLFAVGSGLQGVVAGAGAVSPPPWSMHRHRQLEPTGEQLVNMRRDHGQNAGADSEAVARIGRLAQGLATGLVYFLEYAVCRSGPVLRANLSYLHMLSGESSHPSSLGPVQVRLSAFGATECHRRRGSGPRWLTRRCTGSRR
jgi:hypothetical protein